MASPLPLTRGFGAVTRDALWKTFGDESVVRASWAMVMLSEYRVVQLGKYVRFSRVGYAYADRGGKPELDCEALADAFYRFLWAYYYYSKTSNDAYDNDSSRYSEALARAREAVLRIRRALNTLATSGAPAAARQVAEDLGVGERDAACLPTGDRAGEVARIFETAAKSLFEKKESFEELVELAKWMDRVVGRRSSLFKPGDYSTVQEELRPPSREEVEAVADEVLAKLSGLGDRVPKVLEDLVLNGYRRDAASSAGNLGPEAREYLDKLLDTPFTRVALILAYARVADVRVLLLKLYRAAFASRYPVPVMLAESARDASTFIG